MGIKKRISLRIAFWKFLFILLVGLSGAVLIPYVAMALSITYGIATYANYAEVRAKEIAPIIESTSDLSEVRLPAGINYVLLDKNYQIMNASLEGEELEQAIDYALTGNMDENLNEQFLLIARDEEYVVLQYYIGSRFTNEWMNNHLPPPETFLLILIGMNSIAVCIFLTAGFAKDLRIQLQPLFEATLEVSKQNLDFEVGHSKIKEFEEVLLSFTNMKDSLKKSLELQWKAEQMQREQIAALAHDLKTPLTIIQGNADLLSETALDEEQRLYTDYIIESSEQMQLYIKTLIDISRAATGYQLHMEAVDLSCFLKQIEMQADSLCRSRERKLQMKTENLSASIMVDKMLLERAIMNVVNNALDYSPRDGIIYINATVCGNYLQISVTDEGDGFSQDALLHARELFFMEDDSRSSKLHIGMGLYITESIVGQHKGELILENAPETGGARVVVKIPMQNEL